MPFSASVGDQWSSCSRAGRVTGYLLNDSSSRPGQADGQVSVGMLRKRLPTAVLVWLTNAVPTHRHRPWVEWLKRGLLRLK